MYVYIYIYIYIYIVIHDTQSAQISQKQDECNIYMYKCQLRTPPFCQWQQFLLEFWNFGGSFEEKLTGKIHITFLYACL